MIAALLGYTITKLQRVVVELKAKWTTAPEAGVTSPADAAELGHGMISVTSDDEIRTLLAAPHTLLMAHKRDKARNVPVRSMVPPPIEI